MAHLFVVYTHLMDGEILLIRSYNYATGEEMVAESPFTKLCVRILIRPNGKLNTHATLRD